MRTAARQLQGIFILLFALQASATVRFVDLNSPGPTPPFTGWSTAATNIQDAVDAAVDGDLVLVTNGVYQTGGRLTGPAKSRVDVTNAISVQSLNGPKVTLIQGYQIPGTTNGDGAVRCVSLFGQCRLEGFTLTNGATASSGIIHYTLGGGVNCGDSRPVISNCIIVGNAAIAGAGAHAGTLINCTLAGNTAIQNGGGASQSVLVNCTLFGNRASRGGGAATSTLTNCLVVSNSVSLYGGGAYAPSLLVNCTVVGNRASVGGGASDNATLYNCIVQYNYCPFPPYENFAFCSLTNSCTSPLPDGANNITNEPSFVDLAGGNFRLQTNSPCINVGNNFLIANTADLDGRPRIVGGTADLGAYEFQGAGLGEFTGWLQQNALPTDGSADAADTDIDGLNNWQEWIAGTVPTNSWSVLTMYSPSKSAPGLQVSWQSVSNKTYFLQRSTNLLAQSAFSSIQSNLVGTASLTVYNDATATNGGPYFYRVGVQ